MTCVLVAILKYMCMKLSNVLQSHRQVKDMKPQRKQTRHDVIVQGGQGMQVYIILCEFVQQCLNGLMNGSPHRAQNSTSTCYREHEFLFSVHMKSYLS